MSYPGGKSQSGTYQKIINQISPHRVYIEPFLGGGAILSLKRLAFESIAVDVDAAACADFASRTAVNGDTAGVIVINGEAISFLRSYSWQGGEYVYCDPPYLFETRAGGRRKIYVHEFGEVEQHKELLDLLLTLPCAVSISGYWSALYSSMLATWRAISFDVRTRGGSLATEWLWMNYEKPVALHDYRYLGDNFRERERLARIRRRWLARLSRMDDQERLMLSAAIAESGGTAPSP